ncbi:ABC transporter substrate-binding protein [Clostridium sp. UBA7791]|uniref:ABC transporter substrate-binding protein n=1 Tax=Clostridium sp. UBA7791 TaxID=1946379 RepID=UPI003216D5C3
MVKKIIFTVLCIIIILAGISIEKDKLNSVKYSKVNYITYNMNVNPEDLQLTRENTVRDKDLLITLFEGLVKEDNNGEIVPALAKEIITSEDGLEYTFILREDIYYSTGEKITAEAIKSFFKGFLSDRNNVYASSLDCIYGAKEFREGIGDFSNVAINVKDDSTIAIRLNYKNPYFINIIANPVFNIRDYGTLDKYKENFTSIRYTGPFVIKDVKNDGIYIEKNQKHYERIKITDETIRITFLNSEENTLAIFEKSTDTNTDYFSGGIDIMMDAPINELLRLSQNSMVKSFNGSAVYYLSFNPDKETVGGDVNFRIAINSLLSKEYYSQLICKELLTPATSYVMETDETEQVFSIFGDTEKAKEFFNKVNINENPEIRVIFEKNNLNRRIVEDLSIDIKECTDSEIVLKEYSKEELKNAVDKGDYDIVLQRFDFSYRNPGEYFESFHKISNNNLISYENEEYYNLINSAKYEMNDEKRKIIYEECEKILRNQLISIPIYNINNVICVKEGINQVYVTTTGNIRLEKVKEVP